MTVYKIQDKRIRAVEKKWSECGDIVRMNLKEKRCKDVTYT
jgi:hypothetical protein